MRAFALACAAIALVHASLTAWQSDWTYDEPEHISWSARFIATGSAERVSSRKYNSKTPVMVPNVLTLSVAESIGAGARARRFAARLPNIVWLGLLFAAVHGFARSMGGPRVAHMAMSATALDPNLTAHGSYATVDAPFACATVLVVWATCRFSSSPGIRTGAGVGAALALAVTAKFTGVLLLPLIVAAVGAVLARDRTRWRQLLAGCGATIAIAWLLVKVDPAGNH